MKALILVVLLSLQMSCGRWHRKDPAFWAPTFLVVTTFVFGVTHILVENLDDQR